jgi:thiamine biosynthesis lipoprotein
MIRFEFEAIGTSWQIDIQNNLSQDAEVVLLQKIKERIDIFDRNYSRFRADSLVTLMSQKEGEYALPADAELMIDTYRKIYEATNGLVTPLIGKVLSDAGYDAEYSLIEKEMSPAPAWDKVMDWNAPILSLKESALLDFGAAGKGYLVDIVSEILEDYGITSYCVDAGGDIRQRNAADEVLRVGLENPVEFSEIIGVANVLNRSLCGSAGNRRKWGRFHHIIDPHKLESPKEILAIWTMADTTLVADIATTGLFFVPPEKLLPYFQFEYLIVREDFSIEKSNNFSGEVFTA